MKRFGGEVLDFNERELFPCVDFFFFNFSLFSFDDLKGLVRKCNVDRFVLISQNRRSLITRDDFRIVCVF